MSKSRKVYFIYICLFCVLLAAFFGWGLMQRLYPPIVRLEIDQQSVHLLVGEKVQLTVTGYTADGEPVPPERLEKLGLKWIGKNDQGFEISEDGLLLGLSDQYGSGNVTVTTKNDKLNSTCRPITVKVYQ